MNINMIVIPLKCCIATLKAVVAAAPTKKRSAYADQLQHTHIHRSTCHTNILHFIAHTHTTHTQTKPIVCTSTATITMIANKWNKKRLFVLYQTKPYPIKRKKNLCRTKQHTIKLMTFINALIQHNNLNIKIVIDMQSYDWSAFTGPEDHLTNWLDYPFGFFLFYNFWTLP